MGAFIREEKGYFTLESTLVFPVVLLITVALMFFSLYVFQQATLYARASITADRAAFSWDNSYKNPLTGAYYIGRHDGLYWRFQDTPSGSLTGKKLDRALTFRPDSIGRQADYDNRLLERKVMVHLQKPFHIPEFLKAWLNRRRADAVAHAYVVEPAEFIRNVDLAKDVVALVKDELPLKDWKKTIEAFAAKIGPNEEPQNMSFDLHDQAMVYLQGQVGGVHDWRRVEGAGKIRNIDALDRDRIAHQCFLSYKTNNAEIRKQWMNDVELMERSEVTGVVWHFFRGSRTGTIGPSPELKHELEKHGIIIVIHD